MTTTAPRRYVDAWPWTFRTTGARIMFLSAVAVAVYVTFVLFGSYSDVSAARGPADAFTRWTLPAMAGGAVAFAVGLGLYTWGRARGR